MEASHCLLILFNTVNPTYTVFCLRMHYFFSWNARVFFNSLDSPQALFSLFDELSKFSFALEKNISSNQCNPFWLRSPSISAWSPKKRQRSSLDIDAHNHNRTTSRSPLSKKMFTSLKQKRKKYKFIAPMMHQPPLWGLPSSPPAPTPHAAGLRPRGDEPDQSDQSTEITVIPEVRRGAPGHAEFTQPTHAGSE